MQVDTCVISFIGACAGHKFSKISLSFIFFSSNIYGFHAVAIIKTGEFALVAQIIKHLYLIDNVRGQIPGSQFGIITKETLSVYQHSCNCFTLSGNISIFAGGTREAFERVLPVLSLLGQRILHTGAVGSASQLKVLTNYLCTVHLAALAEALTVAKVAGLDLNRTYEAIRISSGNSFVHETESQVILNGSRDINFTMDLVLKDVGLFDALGRLHGVPLELSPLVLGIFADAARRFGAREFSPNIIRRLEEACGVRVLAEGFPAQMVDAEPKVPGYEVIPRRAPHL